MKLMGLDKEILLNDNAIIFDDIDYGFKNMISATLYGDINTMSDYIDRCILINTRHSYFDFYYSILKNEDKKSFNSLISNEERELLDRIDTDNKQIYYPAREDIMPLIKNVTARGLLFSTFYFSKYPCTIWGNYNMAYQLFCQDKKTSDMYISLAKECNITVI